jgi:hypothetical protein
MIYFVSNLIGLGFAALALFLGFLIGNSVQLLFGIKTGIPTQVAQCLTAVGLDVVYRIRKNEGSFWALFHPLKGGYISYVPIWIYGVAFLAITLFLPWYGKSTSWGGNVGDVQRNNPPSAPLVQQQATSAQPVQSSTAAASQVAVTPAATPTGPPELRSIMWIPTRPSAQLDKSFAFEGDNVRGYKVTKIRQDGVELLSPKGVTLKLALAAHAAGK